MEAEAEAFELGEVVDVRSYGRAEVIEALVTEPGARFFGRIRVKYQRDGATYYARPENLRKTPKTTQRVLLCHSTTHYRTCAASVTNWNDAVLEVGSHEGECTWLLSRRCRYVVGVDKSAVTVGAARRRYPGLRFEAVDGFDVAALKALGPPDGAGFSVVLVDIGGIAPLSAVAALVGLYYKEFPYTTRLVVKSVFLKRLVENSLPYNPSPHNPWALPVGELGAGGGGLGPGGRPGGAGCGGGGGGSEEEDEGGLGVSGREEGMQAAGGELPGVTGGPDAAEGAGAAGRGRRKGRARGRRGRGRGEARGEAGGGTAEGPGAAADGSGAGGGQAGGAEVAPEG